MFKTRPCGCKGIRSCKICETEYGAWNLSSESIEKAKTSYIFCPFCKKLWEGWDTEGYKTHPNHKGNSISMNGIDIILDFISPEEEDELLKNVDKVPWDLSQSGRYKQNYGPKCNFKKKKVCPKNFNGYPMFTKFIQDRFKLHSLLASFQTVEQCSLEYITERGSSIDPHIDDCWIWGERIPTLSMNSDSVLTLNKFTGPQHKYNLQDSFTYSRVVSEEPKEKCSSSEPKENSSSGEPKVNSSSGVLRENSFAGAPKEVNASSVSKKNSPSGGVPEQTYTSGALKENSSTAGVPKENLEGVHISNTQFLETSSDTQFQEGANQSTPNWPIIRIPMPRRSLLILYGEARYSWEHSILREDIKGRRVCITYRELTPPFISGPNSDVGKEILNRSKIFWEQSNV